ncbi:MAG: integrase [Leeuwenhoekiella sp.]|nr:MAG: integrase [Leeuwenhoekiella sp.]
MLQQLFPKYHSRFTQSSAAPLLQGFAEWLIQQGYAHDPAHNHVSRLRRVLEAENPVERRAPFKLDEITQWFATQATLLSPSQQPLYRGTQHAFERYLEAKGQLVKPTPTGRFEALLDLYTRRLRDLYGFRPNTISQHVVTVSAFLEQALPADAPMASLTREAVEAFVTTVGNRVTRQTLQHVVARLRAFLRFCHEQGELAQRLDRIDTPRVYRGELPPRALQWKLVLALLRSIDRSDPAGCRDHAMLYLMAYYGLRPSEVAALNLDSIDWVAQTLQVEQRKTHSTLVLPLSRQALRVLRHYLRYGRSGSRHRHLFLRHRSPAGAISRCAVGDVYEKRSRQSGLPLAGTSAYSLRHAFAMRLLERGIGIKAIGDLLGHRSLESTCVYLRLQVDALRDVALPLPQEVRRSL